MTDTMDAKLVRDPRPSLSGAIFLETLMGNDLKLWRYYLAFKGPVRRSLLRIAEENGMSTKTVQRVNHRLKELGLLRWDSGHGSPDGKHNQANKYQAFEESWF